MRIRVLAAATSLWAGTLWAVTQAQPQSRSQGTIDYQQHVHTILAANCLSCHSAERRSGGLSLASYADALEGAAQAPPFAPATRREVFWCGESPAT